MTHFDVSNIKPNSTELALYYASLGFKVLPIGNDKKPHKGFKWKTGATKDLDVIRELWEGEHKGAAVGIVTGWESNLLVLDIDCKNGAKGFDSLNTLEEQHGKLPDTLVGKTPSGGNHYCFTYDNCNLTVGAGVLDGIDYRGEGGYIGAPGSIIQDGSYLIHADHPIAKMPDWLPDVLSRKAKRVNGQLEPNSGFLQTGSRNNDFASLVGFLHRKGTPEEDILKHVRAMNEALEEPLPDSEIRSLVRSITSYEQSDISVFMNEQDFSYRLLEEFGGKVRYVPQIGFMIDNNGIWRTDAEGLFVKEMVKKAVEKACAQLENLANGQENSKDTKKILGLRKALKKRNFQQNCLEMVKSNSEIVTNSEDLDCHKEYLGLKNGILNIDTKELVPDGSKYLVTKKANAVFDPNAECPAFDQMLERLFPDPKTRNFVLKSLGYAFSGQGHEQCFFIWLGKGQNGKSTLLEAVTYVFGAYSVTLDPQSFIRNAGGQISNDIARLRGARLCVTSETPAGAVLDTALVKRLSGNDKISARYLHKEFFEFENNAAVFMPTNYIPVFDGADGGIVRRIRIVLFDQIITDAEKDLRLSEKLRSEASGILNRLINAYALYRKEGLQMPARVKEVTEKFCNQSNLMKAFISENITVDAEGTISLSFVYNTYSEWAKRSGYKPLSQNSFISSFEAETGAERKRTTSGNVFMGVKYKTFSERNF